ncbi:MAG: Txe/YoeB family addiction module toxin [Bacteroidia bacterium]|nr:MAG: Txe/YoeB family addiction module toxin [Bacteroidia bacterium]
MAKFKLLFTEQAKRDIAKHKKAGQKSTLKRLDKIFKELSIHPYTGTGNPEQLKHQLTGFWSRRINKKDRLIYEVEENIVVVSVISAMGHYDAK